MGTYIFDPNPKSVDPYVLVQMSSGVKTFWNDAEFITDIEQATRYQNYSEAAQVLYKLDEKFVKARIVPMPLSALKTYNLI